MQNVFTIDVEDWYCLPHLDALVPRTTWGLVQSRVHIGTRVLLNLLAMHDMHATFFVLGSVAERDPDLVRDIAAGGHEIASHGYFHHHLETITPAQFRDDVRRANDVLQSITGERIRGYRAPMFSITGRTVAWATDILIAEGMEYSASVFPMSLHPAYGMGSASLEAYRHPNGLLEIPMSCAEIGGRRIPAGGGAYFRHLPYAMTAALARRCNRGGRPLMFYIHPWELDAAVPRLPLPLVSRVRHYRGLQTMRPKLERLLSDFSFSSVRSFISNAGLDVAEHRRA